MHHLKKVSNILKFNHSLQHIVLPHLVCPVDIQVEIFQPWHPQNNIYVHHVNHSELSSHHFCGPQRVQHCELSFIGAIPICLISIQHLNNSHGHLWLSPVKLDHQFIWNAVHHCIWVQQCTLLCITTQCCCQCGWHTHTAPVCFLHWVYCLAWLHLIQNRDRFCPSDLHSVLVLIVHLWEIVLSVSINAKLHSVTLLAAL